jgi:uncharacterized membrane protein YkoI
VKSILNLFLVLVLFSVVISCNDDNDDGTEAIEKAMDKASKSFDGMVINSSREKDDGQWVIKVLMLNEALASVEFEYLEKDISLIEAKGEKGPFDYEVVFDNEIINFQHAKGIAVNEVGNSLENDKLESWSVETDDDFNNKWVYDFEFYVPDKDIYIDAKTGEVLGSDS